MGLQLVQNDLSKNNYFLEKRKAILKSVAFFVNYMSCPEIAIHKKYPYGKT